MPIYLDYLSGVQDFGNEGTARYLDAHGIPAPQNKDVLEQALGYYLRNAR